MKDGTDISDPFRLVGFADAGGEPPSFIVPVFRDLDSDQHAIQVSDNTGRIIAFEPFSLHFEPVSTGKSIIRKVLNPTVFGLKGITGDIYFLEEREFRNKLKSLLDRGEFDDVPAFALNIAKFLKDNQKTHYFNKKVYEQTPAKLTKTRKHFLENNVIREELYKNLSSSYGPLIRSTKIEIVDNKISIISPDGSTEDYKKHLAEEVGRTFKDFMKSDSVEILFDDHTLDRERLDQAVKFLKKGFFEYPEYILDLPRLAGHFAPREAIVLVPDAAIEKRKLSGSLTSKVYQLSAQNAAGIPLSDSTSRRILSADSVTLVSAMLFRLRVLGELGTALSSKQFSLHVACFKLQASNMDRATYSRVRSSVIARRLSDNAAESLMTTLFSFSMIAFLVDNNTLPIESLSKVIKFDRSGYFSRARLSPSFLSNWLDYCDSKFNEVDKSLADTFNFEKIVY